MTFANSKYVKNPSKKGDNSYLPNKCGIGSITHEMEE